MRVKSPNVQALAPMGGRERGNEMRVQVTENMADTAAPAVVHPRLVRPRLVAVIAQVG